MWMMLLCILLGMFYAAALYFKNKELNEFKKWQVYTLFGLRFVAVSIIAFLLMNPFIKTIFNATEKPLIIFAQDNSSSLLIHKDSIFYKENYLPQLTTIQQELSEDYDVKTFTFGEKINETATPNFSDKNTNMAELFEYIESTFYNRNIGALIIASDGIYNEGINPVFVAENTSYPIYTIALGDTTQHTDIILKEALSNKITFLNNQFPIEILAWANRTKGKKTLLTVKHNNQVIFSKEYVLEQSHQLIEETIMIDAKEKGVQKYTVAFSAVDNEISMENNAKDIFIEVLDGRQNILLLANAPHPDIKALKNSIETNKNYEVSTHFFHEFNGNFEAYSLIILHQFPIINYDWLSTIKEQKLPVWYIVGSQSNLIKFNEYQSFIKILQTNKNTNSTIPTPTENFTLFELSNATKKQLESFPPIESVFGTYLPQENGYPLLQQKIGNVPTDNPMLMFFQKDQTKAAFLSGEGIWKWRLFEYAKSNHHQAFDELINKTVQFLSVKDNKDKFRILVTKQFDENEEVIFNAELYNSNYELVNTPEVKLVLKDENNQEYTFVFNKTANAYVLNAGILPVGVYTYTATTSFNNENYEVNGQLQIEQVLVELNQTVANFQLLKNLSEKFNGKFFNQNELSTIGGHIKKNTAITPIIYEETSIKELIHLRWLFFLIIGLLALEWFIRKRNGAY